MTDINNIIETIKGFRYILCSSFLQDNLYVPIEIQIGMFYGSPLL